MIGPAVRAALVAVGLIAAGVALGYGYTAAANNGQSSPTARERAACPQVVAIHSHPVLLIDGSTSAVNTSEAAAFWATAKADRERVAGLSPNDRVRRDTEQLAAIEQSRGDAIARGDLESQPSNSTYEVDANRLASDCQVPYVPPKQAGTG